MTSSSDTQSPAERTQWPDYYHWSVPELRAEVERLRQREAALVIAGKTFQDRLRASEERVTRLERGLRRIADMAPGVGQVADCSVCDDVRQIALSTLDAGSNLGRYRHFKGGEYVLVGRAHDTETNEEQAVYYRVGEPGKLYVRFWAEFCARFKALDD